MDKENFLNMFGAIKQPNGKYSIVEIYRFNRTHKTYHIKDMLKVFGGRWNVDTKRWEDIDEVNLPKIPAVKRLKVRLAYNGNVHLSPNENRDRHVYPFEIQNNQVSVLDMGDSHTWVDIEEIYGEG